MSGFFLLIVQFPSLRQKRNFFPVKALKQNTKHETVGTVQYIKDSNFRENVGNILKISNK